MRNNNLEGSGFNEILSHDMENVANNPIQESIDKFIITMELKKCIKEEDLSRKLHKAQELASRERATRIEVEANLQRTREELANTKINMAEERKEVIRTKEDLLKAREDENWAKRDLLKARNDVNSAKRDLLKARNEIVELKKDLLRLRVKMNL